MNSESQRLTILLAEDNDGHATLIGRNLKRSGLAFDLLRMRDGEETLEYVFRRGAYEQRPEFGRLLVMLDIQMPRVDGYGVLRALKGNQNTSCIPVYVLTTSDDPNEVRRCYGLGCNVYLTKPLEYTQFSHAVQQLSGFLGLTQLPVPGSGEVCA